MNTHLHDAAVKGMLGRMGRVWVGPQSQAQSGLQFPTKASSTWECFMKGSVTAP